MKIRLAIAISFAWAMPTSALSGPTADWIRQTVPNSSLWWAVSADGTDGAYAAGVLYSTPGNSPPDLPNAVLSRFGANGDVLWTRVLATPGWDHAYGVSSDGQGNVYVGGTTSGSLGGSNIGNYDAFLCKFDSAGNLIWQRQIGTTTTDNGEAVATDKLGNVYLSGRTFGNLAGPNAGSSDAFLTKFDSAGSLLWTRQLGTAAGDEGDSVAVDGAGNVYISGGTTGSLGPQLAGQQDAFLSKYDSNGNLQWVRQLGTTADDYSSATAADSLGNVFIAGQTRGSLGGTLSGTTDAFVSKFDSTGALQWTRQFGGAGSDAALGLSTDGSNNVYVTGDTEVFGTNYYNGFDVFLRKLNGEGTVKWTAALGATYDDLGLAASVDGIGGIYVAGYSNASLTNQTAAGPAFIAKFVDIPEPNIANLLLVGACGLLVLCRAPVQFCFPVTPESRHNASRPPTKDFRPFTS